VLLGGLEAAEELRSSHELIVLRLGHAKGLVARLDSVGVGLAELRTRGRQRRACGRVTPQKVVEEAASKGSELALNPPEVRVDDDLLVSHRPARGEARAQVGGGLDVDATLLRLER